MLVSRWHRSATLAAALAALGVANSVTGCGSGGAGGFAPDAAGGGATPSGGSGGTAVGGGGTVAAGTGGTSVDAGADATTDDAAAIDPLQACDQPLEVTPLSCTSEQGEITPTPGIDIPEGVYDRIEVVSPLPPAALCEGRSSLLLTGGIYKLQFEVFGGPIVSGGQYSVNSSTSQLLFTTYCGDVDQGYIYSYSAAEKKLTLFADAWTGWVYVLRQ